MLLQAFSGTQNVSSLQKDEAWRVNVRIQGCDLDHGYLCGTMEALNVPMADTPVRSVIFHRLGTILIMIIYAIRCSITIGCGIYHLLLWLEFSIWCFFGNFLELIGLQQEKIPFYSLEILFLSMFIKCRRYSNAQFIYVLFVRKFYPTLELLISSYSYICQ